MIDPHGPAFPTPPDDFEVMSTNKEGDTIFHGQIRSTADEKFPAGLTVRAYIATRAMQAIIAKMPLYSHNVAEAEAVPTTASERDAVMKAIANGAVKQADALIAELNKEPGTKP